MLRRSRVGTTPDLTRISAGVSRPGIDPRTWVSFGYTLAESSIDKDHGHYVEVKLLPSELELTCRVPSEYAGKQFGSHEGLLHQHDEVVVLIPDGDPNHGGILVSRLWSNNDPPPDLVANNPKDIVRVLETDINYRLTLQGQGQWLVEGADDFHHHTTKKATYEADDTVTLKTPKVRLGEEGATEKLVLGSTYRQAENTMNTQLASALATLMGLVTTAGASLTLAGPLTLLPPAGVAIAAAGAALTSAAAVITQMQTAIQTFDGSATQYLSDVSNTK